MKKKFCNLIIMVLLFVFLGIVSDSMADEWEIKAPVDVNKTGIIEAVLLPELLMRRSDGRYDLSLTGPDGNPRTFELFMRENSGDKSVVLQPEKIALSKSGGFIWECSTPDILLNDIRVNIADRNYLGRIDVEAKDNNGWHYIARDQAVYRISGAARASIDIVDGKYKKLRLHFSGFDKRYKQKIVPINSVTGFSKIKGRDYAERKIDLTKNMRIGESDNYTDIKLILPGSGIVLQSVLFQTGIQFQGRWEIGDEVIKNGKSEFVLKQSGIISHVDSDGQKVRIDIGRSWASKSMVIRLKPEAGFIGVVSDISVAVRLPRLVFSADTPGIYTASTGTGKKKKIHPYAGDAKRVADQKVFFGKPVINPFYNSQTLVEKFQIKGGPFNSAGYQWNSLIPVAAPGYYRLTFNLQASLDDRFRTIRIVKNGFQIPFFFGRNENRSIPLETKSEYDSEKNRTSWIVSLPEISNNWMSIILSGKGIFSRDIIFYKKKPGNTGWEKLFSKRWKHTGRGNTRIKIRYPASLAKASEFKIVVDHGDNQPLQINSFQGVFSAPSICFLAHEQGDYFLFGGSDNAQPANYDLSLVQDRLLSTLPVEIKMGDMAANEAVGWEQKFIRLFLDQSWGLYIILGIVTLLLLGIIIRLFPKLEKPEA